MSFFEVLARVPQRGACFKRYNRHALSNRRGPGCSGHGYGQGFFLAIALLSLAIGIGFVWAGIRSRHYWMAIWGAGLALASIVYIAFVMITVRSAQLS